MPVASRAGQWLAALGIATLVGCASEVRLPEPPPARPAEVRSKIANLLPASTADRSGWAVDIYAAFAAQGITPNQSNICAVLAVTEQESTFRADPPVANLARIAWEEIDRRAERLGVPKLAARVALQLSSSTGKSYSERIDAVKTERELSEIFEDFIGMVPMGQRLFGGLNPVRTGGAMQVSIAFAEEYAREHTYPYAVAGSIRHEVFTRRGGLYFGIAHLLDYPASYDKQLYRFADFNAGRYASRNAAFQSAVSVASGIPLDLDGDLVRHGDDDETRPGSTELAVRSLGKRLDLDQRAIRGALEQGDSADFERSTLYQRVFDLADRIERRPLPRAVVPRIALKGPKISRKLTTEWFAKRVDERHQRCLAR
ncbi:DUF1615 domain-containing protein [Aromatoleum diolicum]|nr:DUF1615 domain-containing protein [Aromatoleum diolicum]